MEKLKILYEKVKSKGRFMSFTSPKVQELTFADIKDREWALETPAAKYLLKTLPLEIREKLRKGFLLSGSRSKEARDVLEYLLKYSTISRILTQETSSAETFEYLYFKRQVDNKVDEYFPRGQAAIGINQRLLALKSNLPNLIRDEIKRLNLLKGGKFIVFNVGSGPGHDMIEVLAENPDLLNRVHVFCIDPDDLMLEIGRHRVTELGISDSFTFIPKKCEEAEMVKAHMILMIGLLCPMKKTTCVKVLKNMIYFSRFGGLIVFSTVQKEMLIGDPLTDFIMRLAGWKMSYKNDSEPEEIARAAGWKPISRFFDSLGFNCMTVARLGWSWRNLLRKAIYPLYKFYKATLST